MTVVIERQENGYVALCPEVDVASQGQTVANTRDNLKEALELIFETASDDELRQRLRFPVTGNCG